jgi:hypothetical protein
MSSELHDLIEKELQAADVRIEAGVRATAPAGPIRPLTSLGVSGAGAAAGSLRRAARHPSEVLREAVEWVQLQVARAKAHAAGTALQATPFAPQTLALTLSLSLRR